VAQPNGGALGRRQWRLAVLLLLVLLGFAFIGRAVISADDGTMMLSEALGLFVRGAFSSAEPAAASYSPYWPANPTLHSRYGLYPSLVFVPFLAIAWPLRGVLGAAGVDAVVALVWAAGAAAACFGFYRVATALKPDSSPLWIPAFLAGTYLWPYAADSFIEPWAAAALGFSAGSLLRTAGEDSPFRRALVPCAFWIGACLLRPVLFVTVPMFVLAALLHERGRPRERAYALWLVGLLAAGLVVQLLGNVKLLGLANQAPPFVYPTLRGFAGTVFLPGRGVLWYAPVVLAGLLAFRKVLTPARLLCFGAPLILLLVAPRWVVWHGGSCWGPRHVLAVLPLLAAPAVLASRHLVVPLLALGAVLNLPGTIVAAGAFQSYAQLLEPPPGATWPTEGGDRVSEVTSLTPLYGHAWLFARAVSGDAVPAPWLAAGARETGHPPAAGEVVSSWSLRRAMGLPPIPPILPRLLVHNALGYLERDRPADALRYAEEALLLSPHDRDAPRLLAEARQRLGAAR